MKSSIEDNATNTTEIILFNENILILAKDSFSNILSTISVDSLLKLDKKVDLLK